MGSNRKIEKLKIILQYLKSNSICDWIIGLHKGNNSIPRMGSKSDDDFLLFGFLSIIPKYPNQKGYYFDIDRLYEIKTLNQN